MFQEMQVGVGGGSLETEIVRISGTDHLPKDFKKVYAVVHQWNTTAITFNFNGVSQTPIETVASSVAGSNVACIYELDNVKTTDSFYLNGISDWCVIGINY